MVSKFVTKYTDLPNALYQIRQIIGLTRMAKEAVLTGEGGHHSAIRKTVSSNKFLGRHFLR